LAVTIIILTHVRRDIIEVMKSRSMRWAEHVALIGEGSYEYNFSVIDVKLILKRILRK
jgi:hypothetical protein